MSTPHRDAPRDARGAILEVALYDLLIFDLDGTLIDSSLDLANSVNATRAHLGLPPIANDIVYSYVGNGAPVLIQRSLGDLATEENVRAGLEYFLSYYRDHMLDNTRLYDGVAAALDALHHAGVSMAVLTNKPVRFSRAIVEGLGLGNHFVRVYGGNSFPEKKPHPIGIHTLLRETGAEAPRTMMVGDSWVDVQTARNAGVASCGVTFGLQPESLEAYPPDFLVDNLADLAAAVLRRRRT